jgi:predicted aspartyl protease
MERGTMGQVLVKAKIENYRDVLNVRDGNLAPDKIRQAEVDNAMVDTGAKMLALPRSMIKQLQLTQMTTRPAKTAAGVFPCNIYEPVWLTVEGRDCPVEVAEVPEDCPVLIGYLALESLDFIVDPIHQRLIPNPQHGSQRMVDMF